MGKAQAVQPATNGAEDSFTKTWGSHTKWKTGLTFGRHPEEMYQISPTRAGGRPGDDQFKPQFDKPLPPLPLDSQEAVAIPQGSEDSTEDLHPQHQPQRSSTSSRSSFGSIFRFARRYAIYRAASKSKAAKQVELESQLQPQPQPTVPPIEWQPPLAPPMQNYEDKGTQTTDDLLPVKFGWKPLMHLPRQMHRQDSETGSINSASTASPLWSPRKFLASTGPGDYFFPSISSAKKSSIEVASLKSQSSSDTQVRIPIAHGPLVEPSTKFDSESRDSLGSYESRYSFKGESGAGSEGFPAVERPALTRKANSESTIPVALKSIPEANDRSISEQNDSPLHGDDQAQVHRLSQSPLRHPFQRLPSFGGRGRLQNSTLIRSHSRSPSPFSRDKSHQRISNTSNSTPTSSLRQEFRYNSKPDDENPEDGSLGAGDYFRMPVRLNFPPKTPGVELDIPDHLVTSPLCPRNPKHKSGGNGVCPMHGRNKSSVSESSGSEGSIGSTGLDSSERRETNGTRGSMPGEFRDGASPFDLIASQSSSNGNFSFQSAVNGAFLLRSQWIKGISEDSIPRVPIV